MRDLSGRGKPDAARAVAVQGNRIVTVGYANRRRGTGGTEPALAIARFRSSGRLDSTFAGNGIKFVHTSGSDTFGADVEIDSRRRIVVAANAGRTDEFNDFFSWDGVVIRLRPDGSLDRRFARDGKKRIDPEGPVLIRDLALAPNGAIGVGGTYYEPDDGSPFRYPSDFAAVRLRPNGEFDHGFSGDGWETTDLGSTGEEAEGAGFTDAGALVVAGGTGRDVALVRYREEGGLDPEFSDDGIVQTSVGVFATANDVTVTGAGVVTVVGETDPDESLDRDFLAIRYGADGELDEGFSGDGVRTDDVGDFDVFDGIAADGGGSILAIGLATRPPRGDGSFVLARYLPAGELDPSFGRDGIRLTDFGRRQYDSGRDVVLDRRGRPVAVGTTHTHRRGDDFAVARYQAD